MTASTSPTSSGIERGGRLVEQHELRVHRQRAGDGDTLLLAAGKLRRELRVLGGQADAVEQLHRALASLGRRDALHPDRCLDDVLQRGHVREQVELLEHHADPLPHAVRPGARAVRTACRLCSR